jgi:uncharacterized protein (TIGR02996 family)
VTSEQDFVDALDAEPDNHHLRLVFSDWLEERGDPRALGFRALGVLKRCPFRESIAESRFVSTYVRRDGWSWWGRCFDGATEGSNSYKLPYDWRNLLGEMDGKGHCKPTRQEAEDDAALAFLNLPPERQAELLAVPVLC